MALLDVARCGGPFGDQRDDRIRRVVVVFAGVGFGQAGHVAGEFDHRHLHAVADAEVRHAVLARELAAAAILPSMPRLPKPPGTRMRVDPAEYLRGTLGIDLLGIHPLQVDPRRLHDAAVAQRLAQRFVGVLVLDILADDGDGDLALRMLHRLDRALPAGQVGRPASRFSCLTTISSRPCLCSHSGSL